MINPVRILALAALFAASAFGQLSLHVDPPAKYSHPLVLGAPYSGEESSVTLQTLADGTHITHKLPSTKIYRDSQGRTRTERRVYAPPSVPTPPLVIEISDPAAKIKYVLDVQNKIAHRQALPSTSPMRPPLRLPPNLPLPPGVEKLGTQTIEGIVVDGTRNTLRLQPAPKATTAQ